MHFIYHFSPFRQCSRVTSYRSPDGQCLILSSRDGYCTIVVFDEILAAYHTQQQTLQLQSIAHHHSLPLTNSTSIVTPISTPSVTSAPLPTPLSPVVAPVVPMKRAAEPPLTPSASIDDNVRDDGNNVPIARGSDKPAGEIDSNEDEIREPPKKKRRAALTHVGDIGS